MLGTSAAIGKGEVAAAFMRAPLTLILNLIFGRNNETRPLSTTPNRSVRLGI
jgi:hypothetical protein